jgi:hypothetical protein
MTSAVSYSSSSLIPVHFGLGTQQQADDMEIRWPSGRIQRLNRVRANQILDVTEPEH